MENCVAFPYRNTVFRLSCKKLAVIGLVALVVGGPPLWAASEGGDLVARGAYLMAASGCADCHTPIDEQGAPLPGRDFAGGMVFSPNGVGLVRSANLTPDADTGIGGWTEQQFVDKFRAFRGVPARRLEGAERQQQTEMPWLDYAGMTDDDLAAIYAYLRTVKPVTNRVQKFDGQPQP